MGAGSKKSAKKLVWYEYYLQQNKVFKKLQKPDIQAGLIQVDLYK